MTIQQLNNHERKFIKKYGMVRFKEHYKRVQSYNTLFQLQQDNKYHKKHYFDPRTSEVWGSSIHHFKNTCFIDRVYGPSHFFRGHDGPKYKYKLMLICEKGILENWAICDSMNEAKKEQKQLLSMTNIEIEQIINAID
tara:strand:- start:525 stop:938 length:414 start_codon:yes stop_codon:yes gene_type:complete